MIGIGIRGLALTRVANAIKALFAAGEVGAWYDPSDFSTMFQDSAGTTPVTAVEQPVGLILDKSGNGKHASQATSASRPVLKQDGNGKYYLLFDGVDDSLATASINFTATDKMTVVAGVRKIGSGSFGIIAELSATLSSNNGTFVLLGPNGAVPDYAFTSKGTAVSEASVNGYESPITSVLTGKASIGTDVSTLRINGTQVAMVATDQGTGNYGNYPLYIGRRAGTSLPFNGHLYSLIVRGAQSTDAQIVSAESYVNSKTGAY